MSNTEFAGLLIGQKIVDVRFRKQTRLGLNVKDDDHGLISIKLESGQCLEFVCGTCGDGCSIFADLSDHVLHGDSQ